MLSRTYSFADPDDYQYRIRASQAEILTSSSGTFEGSLSTVDFERLWIQSGSDSLPRIARTTLDARRCAVMFVADRDQQPTLLAGRELAPGTMAVYGKGTTNVLRTEGSNRWSTLSLAHEDLAAAGEAIAGRELICPSDTRLLRLPAALATRLMAAHARAIAIVGKTPEVLANRAAATALEHELTHILVSCLASDRPEEHRPAGWQRARIVTRFQDFLESRRDEPVYLAEICSAIGASERTLRSVCQEVLGVGPVRYLWLRRMHLARQALLHADPAAATVTGIATDQGFWELGRFSVEYRALFGELPSASLRRQPDRRLGRGPHGAPAAG
jgi:AraC-like DNA-binding protein